MQLEGTGCLSWVHHLLGCLEHNADHSGTWEQPRSPNGLVAEPRFFIKTNEAAPYGLPFIHLWHGSPEETPSRKLLRDQFSLDAGIGTKLLPCIRREVCQ